MPDPTDIETHETLDADHAESLSDTLPGAGEPPFKRIPMGNALPARSGILRVGIDCTPTGFHCFKLTLHAQGSDMFAQLFDTESQSLHPLMTRQHTPLSVAISDDGTRAAVGSFITYPSKAPKALVYFTRKQATCWWLMHKTCRPIPNSKKKTEPWTSSPMP